MDIAQNNLYRQYRIAVAVAFTMALAAMGLLLAYGKDQSFVLINGWNTSLLDLLMPWITHLGNGFIYVPILLITWFFRRDYIVAIIAGIVICFLFTYVLKNYVYPEELRPFSLAARNIAFHKVAGVDLHENYSFPSGHTSTAFTMALLLAALLRQRAWSIVLPFVALLVGFSRIYLAQHFLTDVTAGIMVGISSSYLSLLTYQALRKRRLRRKKAPALP